VVKVMFSVLVVTVMSSNTRLVLELITQEEISVGASNFVEGLNM